MALESIAVSWARGDPIVVGRPRGSAENIGVFGEYSLEELMGQSVDTISTFLAAHEDELGLKDFQDMLEWEQIHRKRSTLIKGLKALIGGEE
jgi:hypothetical protein